MKRLLIMAAAITIGSAAMSQEVVKWTFSANKISDKTYEIHLTPAVKTPWHIYSQTSPEGVALPTKLLFNKNPLITLEGKTKENGKVVSKYEDLFELTVKYFEGKADFVQVVKLKSNARTNLTGAVEFMACTDEQCLPPKTIPFTVLLN